MPAIERALKARAPQAKPASPKPTTPTAPPAFVSAEIFAVRVRVDKLCDGCRTTFAELVEVDIATLALVLQGKAEAPKHFVSNAGAGLELLGPPSCRKCTPP